MYIFRIIPTKSKKILIFLLFSLFFTSALFAHYTSKEKKEYKVSFTKDELNYLASKKVIKVMNLNSFPPFNFYDNNNPSGYTIDYLKLMSNQLGIKFEFVSGRPWNEYLAMLENGTLDLIPHVAINEERLKTIDFTDFKHIIYPIGIVTSKNNNITSIEDLFGKTIAVAKGTFLHSHLEKNFPEIKLHITSTSPKALDALFHNNADAVIGSLPALNYYIQDKWMNNLKSVKINGLKMNTDVELPMGVKKGNIHLKSILEKVHSVIPPSDVLKLKRKWLISKNVVNEKILNDDEYNYLKNKKEIMMCIDPNWMPLEKNENGKHIGMSADYISILEKSIGIDIKMLPTSSWSESLQFGKERRCDIFSMIMHTKEREKFLDFSKPYLEIPLVIATTPDQFFINDINSILDKTIAIVKDYAYVELLKKKYPNIQLLEVNSVEEGLNKVKNKKVFGFIGSLSTVGYSIQRNYVSELKIAGKFEEKWKLSIGVRNDEPYLKDIFNKAIDTLRQKDHQEILNKWISVSYEKGTDYTKLYQASFIFVVVLLLVLYKNRTVTSMNKQLRIANEEINAQQKMVDKYVLIITTDLSGHITDVNSAFCNVLGYKRDELIGQKHTILNHPDIKNDFLINLKSKLKQNKIWLGEIKNITKSKDVCWMYSYIEPLFKNGTKIGYKSICENITNKKRIEELSITDKLTGLYNRAKFDEILLSQIEEYRRYGNKFSIILLDIDDFKKVNDQFGHDVGDNVLVKSAQIIKKNIRVCDVVARWGGEEFIIICKNTQALNAQVLANHLISRFEDNLFDKAGRKTVSMGLTEFKDDDCVMTIFKRADKALYNAKNTGKNKAVLI